MIFRLDPILGNTEGLIFYTKISNDTDGFKIKITNYTKRSFNIMLYANEMIGVVPEEKVYVLDLHKETLRVCEPYELDYIKRLNTTPVVDDEFICYKYGDKISLAKSKVFNKAKLLGMFNTSEQINDNFFEKLIAELNV